jgi:pimeloyl-ACP methyl ester carboxylesterase
LAALTLAASPAAPAQGVRAVAMPAAQAPAPPAAQDPPRTWMLHLTGIAGKRWSDEQLALGLADGGFPAQVDIYDWTGDDPGLHALLARKRNMEESRKIADLIADRVHKDPNLHIILSGHSGGTGIAVWALEMLPPDVKVDKLLLLASALSPDYDLSKALSHVRGHCYSFCSENDVLVLGVGTRAFGTIDGKKIEAAGEGGFVFPAGAEWTQYEKLIQKPYDKSWMQYRNIGDHMGCMHRAFAREIIAPLLIDLAPSAARAARHPAEPAAHS